MDVLGYFVEVLQVMDYYQCQGDYWWYWQQGEEDLVGVWFCVCQ